jgi:hypothetical protein
MPEITATCVRCTGTFTYTARKGPRRLRCDECTRAAKLEGWRSANRRAVAKARRVRAFGVQRPRETAKVEELAGKLAEMGEDERLEVAQVLLKRFGFSMAQVNYLLATAQNRAEVA